MKSYHDWLECKEDEKIKKDGRGGLVPENMQRAKKVDLITLPQSVQGTNCGNCTFFKEDGDHGWCEHKDVKMHVNKRMCCVYWTNPGVKRPWE